MTRAMLEGILMGVASLVSVPIVIFFLECVAALWPRRMPAGQATPATEKPLAVLIPAHNEEAGIAETVRGIRAQAKPGDRVLVVADNCSDATAEKARAEGAEVLERRDPERRGKGYALSFGLKHLGAAPPDVVVFVDADTRVEPGSLDALRRSASSERRPVQAVNLLDPPPGARGTQYVSAFAFLTKNKVRPTGLSRLGIPCHLLGTGMAIPWELIDVDRLATGNIVEDMQMGIDLSIAGTPPRFCFDATVKGSFPDAAKAALVQRTRWEHGHLFTILTQCPRLAWQALRRGRPWLLGMALDLAVPPLALLCLLWILVAGGAAFVALRIGHPQTAFISAGSGGLLFLAVFLAWVRHGRRHVPGHVLLFAPVYVLWKIPVYAGFLFRRQKEWVRTERKDESGVLKKPTPPTGTV
ncbi:MAG TPA: glycosyltransferase family 2 protein [Planctomycetota bacterium]|nr:glycosyltransferase family 2 protein [Planctomycetota bacterium]